MRFTFLKRGMAYSSKLLLRLKPSEHLQDDQYTTRASVTLHGFGIMSWDIWGFPGGSDGKKKKKICLQCRSPQVQSLGQEDPLEKEMATHSSILACRIPWTEESGQTRLNDSHFHFPGVFTDCYVQRSDIDRRIRKCGALIFLKYSLYRNDMVKSI